MKYLINLIAIVGFALLVFGLMKFKESKAYSGLKAKTKQATKHVDDFVKAKKHNISVGVNPDRKPPLTFIAREEKLRQFMPDVFEGFRARDWKEFWRIIYLPIERKKGSFMLKGYRTKPEIKEYCRKKYGGSFHNLGYSHWNYFWELVLGK